MSALVYCPFPDANSAECVATQLLDDRVIACANIGAPMRSLYKWQGESGTADEVPVLFKTDAAMLDRAVAQIEAMHPYDAPAVLGWRCDAVGAATGQWLGGLCGRGGA